MFDKYNINLFLQVRLGSKRLPEKIFKIINDKMLLEHVCIRLLSIRKFYKKFVIVTDYASFERINKFINDSGVKDYINVFAGDENNVLDRFAKALEKYPCDILVRATGDNIFLSREYIKESIKKHIDNNADYTKPTDLPIGTAIEVVNAKIITEINKLDLSDYNKEHVLPFVYDNGDKYKLNYFHVDEEYSYPNLSLTIDFEEQAIKIEKILKNCQDKKDKFGCIPLKEILNYIKNNNI